jgi:hypothetical protein
VRLRNIEEEMARPCEPAGSRLENRWVIAWYEDPGLWTLDCGPWIVDIVSHGPCCSRRVGGGHYRPNEILFNVDFG